MIGKKIEKLLVLKGKSNSGKTATMRALARLMLKKPDIRVIKLSRSGSLDREDVDFTLIVEYRGIRIVLASAGDDKWRLVRAIEVFAKYECNIGVIVVSEPKKEGSPKAVYDYYNEVKEKIAVDIVEVFKERRSGASEDEVVDMINDCAIELEQIVDEMVDALSK